MANSTAPRFVVSYSANPQPQPLVVKLKWSNIYESESETEEQFSGLTAETPVDWAVELRRRIAANLQWLVEKTVRSSIYRSSYWRERCFGLTVETLVGRTVELDHVSGTYGRSRPTPFLCLALKMLQMQPDRETVVGFISNEEHRYLRALGAFYLRLTGAGADVRRYLEPLSNDHREIRERISDEEFMLTDVGYFIDELLTQDSCCDIVLPRI
ncbi:pre-mRNA-splicing factor 38-like [Aegilops tauschii subsp. strangulata]|uniref:pre-mRNA-splicing factor 38-like n=1 Tax=Aegilops tauschii subsp. strangulata TaxID=200361 RepID=UPI00098B9A43|nr:pre-mRNA-splicing factor 38-like [Aegilops tauschii subsp. strangulata]